MGDQRGHRKSFQHASLAEGSRTEVIDLAYPSFYRRSYMSNFKCEHCGAICYDTPDGYITGCEHYPIEKPVPKPKISWLVKYKDGRTRRFSFPCNEVLRVR